MFQCPREHVAALEEVKRSVGVRHSFFDGWMYLFLANKKFDVSETVAKLRRRDEMERTVFAKYTMTDTMRKSMRAGIVQYIGRDKEGRPVLYFNTARDSPKAEQRPERQANLDMFLSWSVRCDRKNPTATVTWLINQENASMLRNTDLIFQKDMALRISKFFPGVIARMFVCNMSTSLTFVMKPLLRQLPSVISDCIFLFSSSDIKKGALLRHIDATVLPVEMGGCNDCDHAPNYERFANTIECYFERCIRALGEGVSIKEMEMMEEFGVDRDGATIASAIEGENAGYSRLAPAAGGAAAAAVRATEAYDGMAGARSRMAAAANEETLDLATMQNPCAVTVDTEGLEITIQSATRLRRRGTPPMSPTNGTAAEGSSLFASSPAALPRLISRVPSSDLFDCVSEPGGSMEDFADPAITREGLYRVHLTSVEEFSFSPVLRRMSAQGRGGGAISEQRDACIRDWISFRCHCVALVPKLERLLEALRLGAELPADEEVTAQLRRCSHFMLDLFPQTRQSMSFPLLDWYATGATARCRRAADAEALPTPDREATSHALVNLVSVNPRRLAFRLDCTSPDNLLLSAQAGAIEFVENWDDLIAVDKRKERVVRRLLLTWPSQIDRRAFEAQLHCRARQLWAQLEPLFHAYIEAKVGISIAEFIRHYGLLVPGGRIDETAEWYGLLFAAVLQYRERHRRNWLFHVFPPLCEADAIGHDPPTMEKLLHAHGAACTDVEAAISFMTLVEKSLRYTADQLSSGGAVATRAIVERYLEASNAKICIPYDMQRSGVLPSESIDQYKRAAAACLNNLEALLQEFLFTMVSLVVLQLECPPKMSEGEIKSQLQLEKAHCGVSIQERREHQRVALSFARVCSELQGSFGMDVHHFLTAHPESGMPADGYALGLEVLLAVSILKSQRNRSSCGSGGGRDGVFSPTMLDPPSVAASSEEDMPVAETGDAVRNAATIPFVDVDSLMETLNAMSHPASRLASLKRRYVY
ncbi:hypothetical protein LSCM1_01339 [Leishmania martiniquensis]|uniref:CRAL-TRIO domain-containing protein n=1 Tax=Leishmania martiniquensis TaxID=1580590 RepID=A0A836H5F1_9TRYP|nr:hypothetical protein LSCM1_01339 [Leishmania martiniquensis]